MFCLIRAPLQIFASFDRQPVFCVFAIFSHPFFSFNLFRVFFVFSSFFFLASVFFLYSLDGLLII